ncbi:hypothetical protein [Plesiocystis pacifica]|nr:hypothetical protein [Plesiocystis pacifica]
MIACTLVAVCCLSACLPSPMAAEAGAEDGEEDGEEVPCDPAGTSTGCSAEDIISLDFDIDPDSAPIVAGQRLEDVYADYGVSISVLDGGDGAIAFASSDPDGASVDNDPDLGTPNEAYGGPGEGSSGASNTVAQHNLLIAAENLDDEDEDGIVDEPDDAGSGATLRFAFDAPVCLHSLVMIDIDDGEHVEFTLTHAGVLEPSDFVIDGQGDNSRVEVDFTQELGADACEVSELTMRLTGSGGIDDLGFCDNACDDDEPSDACPLVVECVEDCEDLSCVSACYSTGSVGPVLEASALVNCITDAGCDLDDAPCIEASCGVEAYECMHGPMTCAELAVCVELCGGDEDCQASCAYESTSLAQPQLEALQACASDNDCQDQSCLEEQCPAELYTCTSGLSDDYSCPLAADCVLGCNNDPVCEINCQPIAPETQPELDSLVACAELNECDGFGCTIEFCPQEWGMCASGDQTCVESLACLQSCYDEPLCEANCFNQAQMPDLFFLDQLLACIAVNGCEDQDCIEDQCGDALAVCEGG